MIGNMDKVIESYKNVDITLLSTNANANNKSVSTIRSNIVGTLLKEHSLRVSPAAQYHQAGSLHIHDLSEGINVPYCYGGSLETLLHNGIVNRTGISAAPSKHLDVAIDHMSNCLMMTQQEWAGAQAFSDVSILLAPYIKKDNLPYEKVLQDIQRFIWNVNFPSRIAFQSPFTNVTLNLEVPEYYLYEYEYDDDTGKVVSKTYKPTMVMIGGETMDFTYADCVEEMHMVTRAFMETMLKGTHEGKPFTFPIPTINITKDTDWDTPTMDLIMQVTAKYGTPYFMNYWGSGIDPASVRAMCCRLNLDSKMIQELNKDAGGLWNIGSHTGSVGIVTLNLAQIGIIARNEKEYFERLDMMLKYAKAQVEFKRKQVDLSYRNGNMPFTSEFLRERGFKTFFNSIGVIGMEESCQNMFGNGLYHHKDFALKVLRHIKGRLNEWVETDKMPWNLEATPGEGASYSLAKKDMAIYGSWASHQGSGDRVYYTSSTQLPTDMDIGLWERVRFEQDLQREYTGGTIFHVYLDEDISDGDAKRLVKRMCEKTKLPYVTLNPLYGVCKEHGYIQGKMDDCPHCGKPLEKYARVVGYFRPVNKFNPGKQQEFDDRVYYGKREIYAE